MRTSEAVFASGMLLHVVPHNVLYGAHKKGVWARTEIAFGRDHDAERADDQSIPSPTGHAKRGRFGSWNRWAPLLAMLDLDRHLNAIDVSDTPCRARSRTSVRHTYEKMRKARSYSPEANLARTAPDTLLSHDGSQQSPQGDEVEAWQNTHSFASIPD
jgi:hypothetical protein